MSIQPFDIIILHETYCTNHTEPILSSGWGCRIDFNDGQSARAGVCILVKPSSNQGGDKTSVPLSKS